MEAGLQGGAHIGRFGGRMGDDRGLLKPERAMIGGLLKPTERHVTWATVTTWD